MSLSPFLTPFFLFIQTPCHSPPLTSRAKGGSKPTYSSPFLLMWKKRSADLIYTEVTKLPLSSCWIFKHIFQWSTWLYELPITKDSYLHQISNQVDLHMRLNYPTKWVYKFDSATQPSGFTKFDSATQPSGFTNLTSPYMTEYYKFYIMGLNMTFSSKIQIWLFITNTKKTSREIIYQNHHNASSSLYSAKLMLPLNLCIHASFSYD